MAFEIWVFPVHWADGYAMLISPNKGETAVHGCPCPRGMAMLLCGLVYAPCCLKVCTFFRVIFSRQSNYLILNYCNSRHFYTNWTMRAYSWFVLQRKGVLAHLQAYHQSPGNRLCWNLSSMLLANLLLTKLKTKWLVNSYWFNILVYRNVLYCIVPCIA